MEAVAGDDDVGGLGRQCLTRTCAPEVDNDRVAIGARAGALVIGDDRVLAESIAYRAQENALKVTAMDRELRVGIASETARWFAVNELAEAIEEGRLLGAHPDLAQCLLEAEPAQHLRGVGQDVDADAEGANLRGRLEDPAGNARFVEGEGEDQPTDSGADDDHAGFADVHADSSRHVLRHSPMPSMVVRSTWPGWRKIFGSLAEPTPPGVPIRTTSPARRVVNWLM